MKKKICVLFILAVCIISFSACGKSKLNLEDYVIEKRENLFVACDDLYSVSFSTGLREKEYNFDGIKNELVPFGVLTLSRNENLPLANDTYSYIVTINDQTYSGFLSKSNTDNSYVTDLEVNTIGDESINVQISFTGYTFNKNLENISSQFQVDGSTALKITKEQLHENIENILSDKNVKIEIVMKMMKDYSNKDLKNYYWYVGIISTNGETLGILIDANNGDIIAKKV
jgi:hypothetical protein